MAGWIFSISGGNVMADFAAKADLRDTVELPDLFVLFAAESTLAIRVTLICL